MRHPGSYEAIETRTRDLFRQIGIESGSWKFCIFLMVFEKLKPHAQLYLASVANINHNFTCRQNTTPTAENTNYRHTRNTPHIRIMSRTIIKVIILYKFFKAPTQRLGLYTMGKVIVSVVEMR